MFDIRGRYLRPFGSIKLVRLFQKFNLRALPLYIACVMILSPLLFHTRSLWLRPKTNVVNPKRDFFPILDIPEVKFVHSPSSSVCKGLGWNYDFTVPDLDLIPANDKVTTDDFLYVDGPWWYRPRQYGEDRSGNGSDYTDDIPIHDFVSSTEDSKQTMSLLIALYTPPKLFDERTSVREIWSSPFSAVITRRPWVRRAYYDGKELNFINALNVSVNCKIEIIFVLGLYEPTVDANARQNVSAAEAKRRTTAFDRERVEVRDGIRDEAKKYGDILQSSVVDSYANLSYKTGSLFKWANTHCSQAQFILKMDYDVYARLDLLLALLENVSITVQNNAGIKGQPLKAELDVGKELLPFQKYLYCNVWESMSVIRDAYHKNAVAKSLYSPETYPSYCSGMAYAFSPRLAGLLYQTSLKWGSRPLPNEDSFWTGVIAGRANISHVAINRFYLYTRKDWTGGPFIFAFYANVKHLWDLYFGKAVQASPF